MTDLPELTSFEGELQNLRTACQREFPGNSSTLEILREALVHAHSSANHSRACLHASRLAVESSGLPLHLWDLKSLQQFNLLKRQYALDSRHCTLALQSLMAACATLKAIEARTPPPVPPPPPKKEGLVMREQIIEVTTTNGHSEIIIRPNADVWCNEPPDCFQGVSYFTRRFLFYGEIVPDCLAWVLTHDGITYEPVEEIAIDYLPEEFKRLCELQLASDSDQLIDGERYGYHRRIIDLSLPENQI